MSLQQLYLIHAGLDCDFLHRVAGACLVASRQIKKDKDKDKGKKAKWAAKAKENPKTTAREVISSIIEDDLISDFGAATDEQVQAVVDSLVDNIEGGDQE